MLRETNFNPSSANEDLSLWALVERETVEQAPLPAVFDEALAMRSEPAFPDVPPGVGFLICGTYLGLMAALAFATVAPGPSTLALAVAMFFVAMFFAVPKVMLAQEKSKKECHALDQFLANGMMTATGHCSGAAALVQMLVVPATLTVGVLVIAVIVALV